MKSWKQLKWGAVCIQYLIILTVRTLFLQVGGITDMLPISAFTQKFKARGDC